MAGDKGQGKEKKSPEGKGHKDKGQGWDKHLRKAGERPLGWGAGEDGIWWRQDREGSKEWWPSRMGAAGGAGARAADLPGVLRSGVRGGHSLQTKRGRSSAERGGPAWPVGWVGGVAGQAGQ